MRIETRIRQTRKRGEENNFGSGFDCWIDAAESAFVQGLRRFFTFLHPYTHLLPKTQLICNSISLWSSTMLKNAIGKRFIGNRCWCVLMLHYLSEGFPMIPSLPSSSHLTRWFSRDAKSCCVIFKSNFLPSSRNNWTMLVSVLQAVYARKLSNDNEGRLANRRCVCFPRLESRLQSRRAYLHKCTTQNSQRK